MLNAHSLQKELIESILEQAVSIERRFHTWPLEVQREYEQKHQQTVAERLQELKPHGIEATTVLEAVEKFETLERTWQEQEMASRADLAARFYSFLVAEERAEINSFLARENLIGKAESDYTLHQKADLRRIQNRWANLKEKAGDLQ